MCEYLMYLRKSRQDDPNETVEEVLAKHELILQEYALTNFGYRIPEEHIYREVVSGETIEDRPKIKEIFSLLEKKNIVGILCIDTSRLTRGDLYECGVVSRTLQFTSTKIITPNKIYDLSDKYDKKFFEMELTKGNDYLEYSTMIMARGRTGSMRRGNWIHRNPPYGYDRIKIGKDHTLAINEKEAIYIRMLFEMYAEGIGLHRIANRLEELGAKPKESKHFKEGTLRQMLQNEVYIGKIRIGERTTIRVMEDGKIKKKRIRHKDYEIVEGKHEAIISEELFEKVKERFGKNTKETGQKDLKNMWAGLIKCSKCGSAMTRVDFLRDGVSYRKPRIRCKSVRVCDNMSHNLDEVHDAIVDELKIKLEDFTVKVEENNHDTIKEREELLNVLYKQLEDVKKKQDMICEHLENGVYTVDMFVSRKNKLQEEKDRIKQAIENTENEIPNMKAMQEQLVTFHETLDMLDDDTIPAKVKNTFLKKIVDVIYYTKTEEEITLDIHLLM